MRKQTINASKLFLTNAKRLVCTEVEIRFLDILGTHANKNETIAETTLLTITLGELICLYNRKRPLT